MDWFVQEHYWSKLWILPRTYRINPVEFPCCQFWKNAHFGNCCRSNLNSGQRVGYVLSVGWKMAERAEKNMEMKMEDLRSLRLSPLKSYIPSGEHTKSYGKWP